MTSSNAWFSDATAAIPEPDRDTGEGPPLKVFAETLAALAQPTATDAVPSPAGDTPDCAGKGHQPTGPPTDELNGLLMDPDTPEGAAILRLFRMIKDVEKGVDWPGADVVDQLTTWFTDLGIDPDEHPMDAARRLRLALREQPGGRLFSAVYGVRIGTDHNDPEPIIRATLTGLARQLGPGTGIDLAAADRDLRVRIEQHPLPTRS